MSSLKLRLYPHKDLQTRAQPVTTFDEFLQQTVYEMSQILYHLDGYGLAANQVGILQRICMIDISESRNELITFINPIVVEREGVIVSKESCLSIPGISVEVPRAKKIRVQYKNDLGQELEMVAEDMLSCCLQHEIDHLDGIVLLDYLSKLKRSFAIKKLQKNLQHHLKNHAHCNH